MKKNINVVIVGAGQGGTAIIRTLLLLDDVNIRGIADIKQDAPGIQLAKERGILVSEDFKKLIKESNADVIIEATGVERVRETINNMKSPQTVLIQSKAAFLMMKLVNKHEELMKEKELRGHLETILNSAQEGIQAVDSTGKILYVNKAFSEISKKRGEDYIGKNVFDVSPNGSLAKVLKTKKPVFGLVNIIRGTNVEVVSNASPIFVDGQVQGAVVIFRDISDVKRLGKMLEESKETIKFLKDEISQLVSAKYFFSDIIGEESVFCKCIDDAKKAAKNDSNILIIGESGTGKELFAHAIHNYSSRAKGPFVKVNCAAIPENLLESEMFGHEKGAFTGAVKAKMGKFELADGGTIFLDEIGDMSISLQAKLLRVLQEGEVERVGSHKTKIVDVRVIAATNQDLTKLVDERQFRSDLYYRLKVIHLEIPPLRKRKKDIELLAVNIIGKLNKHFNKACFLDTKALEVMKEYSWPGNIRELKNLLERAVILTEENAIGSEVIKAYFEPFDLQHEEDEIMPLAEMEKRIIFKALEKYGENLAGKKKVAQKLQISLATLYNKLEKYNK